MTQKTLFHLNEIKVTPLLLPNARYGNIVYDENCYDFQKMEAIWYNTELAITGPIRDI